ncbi:MAG: FtsW/RodA/SpoVE family cell cycle protein, partial [Clostridia bacterium]|nr:FtsW/RodA/SpoVE family cell cycle protein [Clostridia bacterium]
MREEQRNQKTGTARTPRENRPSAMVQGRKPVQQKQTAVEQSPKSSPEPQGLVARGRQKLQVMSSRADERWEEKGNALVRTRGSMDRTMLSLILILLALGSIMVFSASYPSALAQKGNSLYYITRHMFFVITGVVAMLAISKFPLWVFEDYAPVAFGIAVFLLIFVLIPTPFSVARGEARRWLIFGSITVQPSEIMKAALILMLARYLGKHQQDMVKGTRSWGGFFVRSTVLPGLFLGFACILVLAENHLSGMLIMGMIGAVVLFMGGVPWYFLLAVALTLGGAAVVLFVTTQDYALERLTSF